MSRGREVACVGADGMSLASHTWQIICDWERDDGAFSVDEVEYSE